MTEMAEWQCGIELETLKRFAEPFKQRHKHLVFGAFGLTKERDVAEALSKNRAIWTGAPGAIALFNQSKTESEHRDFAQRPYTVPAGAVVIKAAAALDIPSGIKVLSALIERAQGAPVFAELFEEDDIIKQAALTAGMHYVTTKISAGSEIKGIYLANAELTGIGALPPAEAATLVMFDREFLTREAHAAILAELAQADTLFAQHYSDYNKRKSWTAFALRGYSDDPTFIIKPSEMSKSWKDEHPELLDARPRETKAAAAFPTTLREVKRLGLLTDRVRFMRLRARDGELSRHADITDREAGVADGMIARLHIPIRTSPAVTFMGWTARGERLIRQFPERSIFYLDQRKPHAVKNTDPGLDRIHLVIDCVANATVRSALAEQMEMTAAA